MVHTALGMEVLKKKELVLAVLVMTQEEFNEATVVMTVEGILEAVKGHGGGMDANGSLFEGGCGTVNV